MLVDPALALLVVTAVPGAPEPCLSIVQVPGKGKLDIGGGRLGLMWNQAAGKIAIRNESDAELAGIQITGIVPAREAEFAHPAPGEVRH